MRNGSIDSQIFANRARAERAYQNASKGSGLNPKYVSTIPNQKPVDYVDNDDIAFGSYPVGNGFVQNVQWNENTNEWDDFGVPIQTVVSSKIDSIDSLNFAGIVNGQVIQVNNYYDSLRGGGDAFVWSSSENKQNHDGGNIIDPDHTEDRVVTNENWYIPQNNGSGCWIRKNKENAIPEDYGCKGDGLTKDTFGFQKMLDNNSNIFCSSTYLLDSLKGERGEYNIEGSNNATLDFSENNIPVSEQRSDVLFQGSQENLNDLGSDVSKDDTQIEFNSNHNLSVGDLFYIYNETDGSFSGWRPGYRAGEICKVKSIINNSTVEIFGFIYASYDKEDVDVYKINAQKLSIENIKFIGNDKFGLETTYGEDTKLDNLEFSGIFQSTVRPSLTYGVDFNNISIKHTAPASLYSYGLQFATSQNINISNCNINTFGDSIESSGGLDVRFPSRNVTMSNVFANNSVSFHGGAEYGKITHCTAQEIVLAGDHMSADHCVVHSRINIRELIGYDFSITNNTIKDTFNSGSSFGDDLRFFSGTPAEEHIQRGGTFIFEQNTVYGFGYFNVGSVVSEEMNLVIKDNYFISTEKWGARLDIRSLSLPDEGVYNSLTVSGNVIKTKIDNDSQSNTYKYYPDLSVRFYNISAKELYVENNTFYGRPILNFSTSKSHVVANIKGNNFIKATIAPFVAGNSDCTVFFENNKSIDNLRVDGQSFSTRSNVYFVDIESLYIKNNSLGDIINNDVGRWISLINIDKIYTHNNTSLNQDSKRIQFGGGTGFGNIIESSTGLGHKKSGVVTILSGENSAFVALNNFPDTYNIFLTGTNLEVSNCIVADTNGLGFEIQTGDGSNVTEDRKVYWKISL